MKQRRWGWTQWVVVMGILATGSGCQFSASASASADAKSGADAAAEAKLEGQDEPENAKPKPKKTITYREGQLDYDGTINFEYNKAKLQQDEQTTKVLDEFVVFLNKYPSVEIEIQGHTDSRGSDDYNRDLSDRRAASVRYWLVQKGIAEARLTAVGKGEDEPQTPEPEECDDKRPKDTTPCEEVWATNRRVVFQVTGGDKQKLEKLESDKPPEAKPEPEPEPEPVAQRQCPWLLGPHLNLIGPNAWIGGAIALQPGICWLEPSLGVSFGFGDIEAESPPTGASGEGEYSSLNIPLRARIWFMDEHSVIGDVGLGFSSYSISATMTDNGGTEGDYNRDSSLFWANLGVGYGYRPNRVQGGPRLGVVIGAVLPFGDLDASTTTPQAGFSLGEAAQLQDRLDSDSDSLASLRPYAEISLGWLFDLGM